MNTRILTLAMLAATTLSAQVANYLGPGILTTGSPDLGTRGGREDLEIRPYVTASGFYDTGLLAVTLNQDGTLPNPGGQYGVLAGFGAYGRHNFQRSVLKLDYNGNYAHYTKNQYYNGSNHQLALGYTHQLNRRFVLDVLQTAGTISQGNQFISSLPNVSSNVVDSTSQLFDNRANYLQSSMSMTYLLSARTSVTAGGSGNLVRRQSKALVGLNGWIVQGSIDHRSSANTTIGASFQHRHVDFSQAFGESNIEGYSGMLSHQFGRNWVLSLTGGLLRVETQGLQRVSPDSAVQGLFGSRPVIRSFYRLSNLPQTRIVIVRGFRNASWSARYTRGVNNGNGVLLTSRTEGVNSSFSYQGREKWAVSLSGGYDKLTSVGQDLKPYNQITARGAVTYALTRVMNFQVTYTFRRQKFEDGFDRDGSRIQIGFSFAPAGIPLSFF